MLALTAAASLFDSREVGCYIEVERWSQHQDAVGSQRQARVRTASYAPQGWRSAVPGRRKAGEGSTLGAAKLVLHRAARHRPLAPQT